MNKWELAQPSCPLLPAFWSLCHPTFWSLCHDLWTLRQLQSFVTLTPLGDQSPNMSALHGSSLINQRCLVSCSLSQPLLHLFQNRFTSACSNNQQENFDDGTIQVIVRHRLPHLLFQFPLYFLQCCLCFTCSPFARPANLLAKTQLSSHLGLNSRT